MCKFENDFLRAIHANREEVHISAVSLINRLIVPVKAHMATINNMDHTELAAKFNILVATVAEVIHLVAFFYAGFAAWYQEHSNWQTERDLRIASQTSHRKTEVVEGLKGLYSQANDLFLEGLLSIKTEEA